MSLFHSHQWREIGRHFAAPPFGSAEWKLSGSSDTIERLTFGVTTITLRCSECGDMKSIEQKGDARLSALQAHEKTAP